MIETNRQPFQSSFIFKMFPLVQNCSVTSICYSFWLRKVSKILLEKENPLPIFILSYMQNTACPLMQIYLILISFIYAELAWILFCCGTACDSHNSSRRHTVLRPSASSIWCRVKQVICFPLKIPPTSYSEYIQLPFSLYWFVWFLMRNGQTIRISMMNSEFKG